MSDVKAVCPICGARLQYTRGVETLWSYLLPEDGEFEPDDPSSVEETDVTYEEVRCSQDGEHDVGQWTVDEGFEFYQLRPAEEGRGDRFGKDGRSYT